MQRRDGLGGVGADLAQGVGDGEADAVDLVAERLDSGRDRGLAAGPIEPRA